MNQELPTELKLPTETDRPALLTFDALRAGVRERYRRMWALEVDYCQTTRVCDKTGGIVPRIHRRFAYQGEKRFLQEYPVVDDPLPAMNCSTMLFDGGCQQDYHAEHQRGCFASTKQQVCDLDYYVDSLGISLTGAQQRETDPRQFFLPQALDAAGSRWRVLPKLAIVDGAECHVLESDGRQRVWLDPTLGCAMRFRERYLGSWLPRALWPRETRYAFRDFAEADDGLWLPRRVDAVCYSDRPGRRWNKPSYSSLLDVIAVRVNTAVPDSLFTFAFPPGTRVVDMIRRRNYRVGEVYEELDVCPFEVKTPA